MSVIDCTHIRHAFKSLRRSDDNALASSVLHTSKWMMHCRLEHEPDDVWSRSLQTQTLLHWLIEQLAPIGQLLKEKQQQNRAILYYQFVEDFSTKQLMHSLKIGRSTIYPRTTRALTACVELLQISADTPRLQAACHFIRARLRYEHATSLQQNLLRQLSVYQHPNKPSDLLHTSPETVAELQVRGWIVGKTVVDIAPQMRAFVVTQVSAEEQQRWIKHIAHLMERQGRIWQAHVYLFQGKRFSQSAELLLKYKATLLQFVSLNQLVNAIEAYKPNSLSKNSWTKLKLLAARYASRSQDQETALSHLQAANPSNSSFRAFTELHLAIVKQQADRQAALNHFELCLRWAKQSVDSLKQEIVLEAHIRRAWVYLSDPVELNDAQVDLETAKALIATCPPNKYKYLRILLCNTEGKFYTKQQKLQQASAVYQFGLQLADDVDNIQLKIFILHNLALLETRQKRESLPFLLEGKALAQSIDDQATVAHFEKSIGGYYFHKEDFARSADHNERAYQICSKIENSSLLALTSYDLAEALAYDGRLREASTYFAHAKQYAKKHKLTALADECVGLATRYPELAFELTDSQLAIIHFVRQSQRAVSTQELAQQIQVSKATVQRYIQPILATGILKRIGSGRTTAYEIVNSILTREELPI